MTDDLRDALAARRRRPQTAGADTRKARAEAHHRLRLERGAEAATYCRQAASAVVDPRAEFATRKAWRAFLDRLYPQWAAEIGEALYDSGALVVIDPAELPRPRSAPRSYRLDLRHFGAMGFIDGNGWWRIPVGEPLPDDPAGYVPRPRITAATGSARRHGHLPIVVRREVGPLGLPGEPHTQAPAGA